MAQSRERLPDYKKRDLEGNIDELVYLKVSPMKGVMRFNNEEE